MIRPININLNAAHPELPLTEATTFTGSPSTVFIRGVPKAVGNWTITSVQVAVSYPDNSTTSRAAVESAEGVWVATIPGTATSGRTEAGFRILANGIDENGAAVTGYVLGFADFSVFSFLPVPAPGETFYLLRYFDTMPTTPKKGDATLVDGVLKFYNGTAWEAFANLSNYVPTSRAINGKALTDNVSLSGSDIPTSAAPNSPTLANSISTLTNTTQTLSDSISTLNDTKASKAATTLTERGFSTWTILRDGVDVTAQVQQPYWEDDPDAAYVDQWIVLGTYVQGDFGASTISVAPQGAAVLSWYGVSADNVRHSYTATRTALQGYMLGSQSDKPLASEAEAEALRQGKQNTLTTQQLANIAAVSDALAFDATHSYAAGDPVVYNGTLYTFTVEHAGAWTESDAEAVDIIAMLAGKLNKSSEDWKVSYTDSGLRIADTAGVYYIEINPTGIRTNFPNSHNVFWPTNGGTTALLENLAGNFSSSASYAKDALVVYMNALYRCVNSNGHTGAWVNANWAPATVEDILAALRTGKASRAPSPTSGNLAALDADGNPTDSLIPAANVALKSAIPYSLGAPIVINTASSEVVEGETVYYGAATLANRTANIVQVTAATALDELRITFPSATSGKVRDFGLRVEIGTGSAALAAPALVPIAPTGETIKLENADGAIPELADGTATAKGVTLLYFSETAPGVFVVKGEQVEEVA